MDSSKIKAIIIVVAAALAALYLGIAVATAQLVAIAWVVGALGIVFVLGLGKHIWILIPLTLPLQGVINAIPGGPFPWWGAMAVTTLIYTVRFLMRRTENLEVRFTWLDFAILIQIIAIGQAYIRNPTGLLIMGGEMAGGKPYFIFGFAFVAYAMLSITKTDIKVVRWVVLLTILAAVADSSLSVLSQYFPVIAIFTLPLYSNVVYGAAVVNAEYQADISRLEGGKDIGQHIGLAAFSLFPPISTLNPLRIGRFVAVCFAVMMIFLSGFRSALGLVMIYFIVGSLVRRQTPQLVIAGFAALIGLLLVIGSGVTNKLPYGAQRVFSALPFVQVDDHIRLNAEASNDFRFDMWRLALTTNRYISNKYLGDGFGLSASEQQAMLNAAMGDQRAQSQARGIEDFMARGSYHGFHVETIRFTGVLGLIAALMSMGIFFKSALKLIRHFEGRPEWGYIIYICMPFLIYPFYYMLVFGSYRSAFPAVLASAGLLKILDNIRVRELAAARAEAAVALQAPSQAPLRSLPTGRFPQPAMKTR
jgi:hypothetical protein